MKIKLTTLWISLFLILFNYTVSAEVSCIQTSPLGWIDRGDIRVSDGAFYIDTNLGPVKLTVIEYDEEKERYLVECIKYGDLFYPSPEESLN